MAARILKYADNPRPSAVEIQPLDNDEAVRGAIEARGRAWQEAYDDILAGSAIDQVTVDPGTDEIRAWRDRLPGADDPAVARCVRVRGRVRGYVFVRWGTTKAVVGPGEAGLKELYVHPDWWGGGLGTDLLGAAVGALPPTRDGLALETLAANDLGRGFYESRGFVADGRSELALAGDSHETVIYRRPVG